MRRDNRTLLLTLAVSLLLPTTLLAQDTGIVITGSRIPEEFQTSPAVIRVIDREELSDSTTVIDALDAAPELTIVSTAPGSRSVTMGGFGEAGFARVLVLRDGVPLNRPDLSSVDWLAIPIHTLERIEILTGGASAAHGDQAVAGAINLVSREYEEPAFTSGVMVDSNLSNRLILGIAVPGEPVGYSFDLVRESFSPSRERSDAEATRLTGGPKVTFGSYSADLSIFWEPSTTELPGGISKETYDSDPDTAVNDSDTAEEQEYGVSVRNELDLFPLTLSLPASYRRRDSAVDFASLASYSDTFLDQFDLQLIASQELFLSPATLLTVTGGFDYALEAIAVERFASPDRRTTTFEADVRRDGYATWLRGKIGLSELVFLEGGVRYELARVEASSPDADLDEEVEHAPFVYDAGVAYTPNRRTKVNLRYARLFRYPLLDEQVSYFGFGSDTVYGDLDPEEGHSFTLGASTGLGEITGALSSYLTMMEEEIRFDPETFRNVNGGETVRFGGGATVGWEPRGFSVRGAYNYDRPLIGEGENEGNQVPLVPNHSVSLSGEIDLTPTVSLGSDWRYRSRQYKGGDLENSESRIPPRSVWDAELAWSPVDSGRVYLAVRNILDDRTPTSVFYSAFSGEESWYPEEGRRLELGSRFSF
ncbi:MAG: TonB-dependent receptor [Spirochaetaceae bacterium]